MWTEQGPIIPQDLWITLIRYCISHLVVPKSPDATCVINPVVEIYQSGEYEEPCVALQKCDQDEEKTAKQYG